MWWKRWRQWLYIHHFFIISLFLWWSDWFCLFFIFRERRFYDDWWVDLQLGIERMEYLRFYALWWSRSNCRNYYNIVCIFSWRVPFYIFSIRRLEFFERYSFFFFWLYMNRKDHRLVLNLLVVGKRSQSVVLHSNFEPSQLRDLKTLNENFWFF